MAQYKVIQDIEADEKFVGPLTLKQFIFACVAVVAGFIAFNIFRTPVWPLALPFVAVFAAAGFLAFPWGGKDQPTELWLLAKAHYFFKPKRRIWDQAGVQELVTITAPKKIEQQLTNNLSQTEVKSRLKALAETIDSHGWAIKNVNVNLYAQPGYVLNVADSDRLIDPSTLPNEVSATDIQAADDMMDEENNPIAQGMEQRIAQAEKSYRQAALEKMQVARTEAQQPQNTGQEEPAPNFWFMEQPQQGTSVPAGYTTFQTVQTTPQRQTTHKKKKDEKLSKAEKELLEKIHKEKDAPLPASFAHMKVILTPEQKRKAEVKASQEAAAKKAAEARKRTPDPAILNAAINNTNSVASLAKEMSEKQKQEPLEDEVVISLH